MPHTETEPKTIDAEIREHQQTIDTLRSMSPSFWEPTPDEMNTARARLRAKLADEAAQVEWEVYRYESQIREAR